MSNPLPETDTIPLRRGRFQTDAQGEDFFTEGYHDPEDRWNGFATPLFEFEPALKLCRRLVEQDTAIGMQLSSICKYDFVADAFIVNDAGDPEMAEESVVTCEGIDVFTVDGIKHVYAIGTRYWTWSEEYDYDHVLTPEVERQIEQAQGVRQMPPIPAGGSPPDLPRAMAEIAVETFNEPRLPERVCIICGATYIKTDEREYHAECSGPPPPAYSDGAQRDAWIAEAQKDGGILWAIRERVVNARDGGGFVDAVAHRRWEQALNKADAGNAARFVWIMQWRIMQLPGGVAGEELGDISWDDPLLDYNFYVEGDELRITAGHVDEPRLTIPLRHARAFVERLAQVVDENE